MPFRFTLRQLEYFVAVGELGSVAQAAARMNVSPPSISTAIGQLEAEFGIQLFIRRHAQGLSLTPSGRRLHGAARALLGRADELNVIAGDMAEGLSGPLNIGCLQTFAPLILPELRRRFEALYPNVLASQVEGDHAALLAQLRNGALDVVLTYALAIPNDVCFEALVEMPPYAMVSGDDPLAAKTRIAPRDLADKPMVLLDLPISADYFLSMLRDAGVPPRIAERSRDMALVRAMVANGYGYSLANVRPRTELSPDGKPLKFVPLWEGAQPLQLGLVTGKATHKTRSLLAFEEHCRAAIAVGSVPGLSR